MKVHLSLILLATALVIPNPLLAMGPDEEDKTSHSSSPQKQGEDDKYTPDERQVTREAQLSGNKRNKLENLRRQLEEERALNNKISISLPPSLTAIYRGRCIDKVPPKDPRLIRSNERIMALNREIDSLEEESGINEVD